MRGLWMIAAALAVASPAWALETAQFSVGGVAFEIDLPPGFCLPAGAAADEAAAMARRAPGYITHLTAIACDREPFAHDYFTISTNKDLADLDLNRDRLLNVMIPENARAMTDGGFPGAIDQSAELFDSRGNFRPVMDGKTVMLGMDDFCLRGGGPTTLRGRDGAFVGMLGVCVAVIGRRHMIVESAGRGYRRDDMTRQLRFSRMIAERIRVKP